MNKAEQELIKGEDLKSVVENPATFNSKIVTLRNYFNDRDWVSRQTKLEMSRSGDSSPDWLLAPEAVQYLLNRCLLTLRAEPETPSERIPSPDAFLARHGLTRPNRKAPAAD